MTLKIKSLLLIAIPALAMIGLIPFIKNDYLLTLLYTIIIVVSLSIKYESKDFSAYFSVSLLLLFLNLYL